ncbi:MAG: 1-acyl-sn-glycerol-3-phosphate acyltransferase [Candidatus Cloacimonetes bacterium]|nr:1-acyl-sn-glycerol-3-phosphate acyltransferase [Candidatus Cloacimonadota bacterium]
MGSVILAFNHLTLADVFVLLKVLFSEANKEIKEVIVPGSRRHWGNPVFGLVMRAGLIIGVRVIPIVQHYERGIYFPAYTASLDRKFVKALHQVLSKKGCVILFAPEGHRSENGYLQPPQKGVEFLLKLVERKGLNTVAMPIGIEPQEGFSRGINFGRRFTIHFGRSLSPEEIGELVLELKISPAWIIMQQIAALLPARLIRG